MDEKRSRISTSPVTNPFFYRSMVIPDHPHTPEEFSLQMKVDIEGLRMEIILSQPPSPECDTSPRRAVVDTGSEEPGTPPQSPAISTGSGPEGDIFSFEASRGVFLRSKCTSLEEEYILLQVQPDGMDDSNNATTSQDTTCEESARLLIGQQQRMAAWSTDQSKQFDTGKTFVMKTFVLLKKYFAYTVFALFLSVCIFVYCPSIVFFHFAKIAEAGMKDEISYLDAPDA